MMVVLWGGRHHLIKNSLIFFANRLLVLKYCLKAFFPIVAFGEDLLVIREVGEVNEPAGRPGLPPGLIAPHLPVLAHFSVSRQPCPLPTLPKAMPHHVVNEGAEVPFQSPRKAMCALHSHSNGALFVCLILEYIDKLSVCVGLRLTGPDQADR